MTEFDHNLAGRRVEKVVALSPNPNDNKEERDFNHKYSRSQIIIGMVCLACVFLSGYMSLIGIEFDQARDGAADFNALMRSLPLAGCVSISMWCGWWVIMNLTPLLRGGIAVVFYIFAVLFTLWCVGVSSYYNAASMFGRSALISEMIGETNRLSFATDSIGDRATKAEALLPALRAIGVSACARFDDERDNGGLTGSAGVGAVSQSFLSVCESTKSIVGDLEASSSIARARSEGVTAELESLQRILINREISVMDREDAFRQSMERIFGLLREIGQAGLVERMRGAVVSLRTAVAPAAVSGSEFGATQAAVVDQLRAQMDQSADALQSLIPEDDIEKEIRIDRTARVSLLHAMLGVWDQYLPAIFIAVGLDVYPLAMMSLLLVAAQRNKNTPRRFKALDGFFEVTAVKPIQKPAPKKPTPPRKPRSPKPKKV